MSHELATASAILDSHITSAQFDAAVAHNRFLHDCKTKGFKRLQAIGRFGGGIELKEKTTAPEHTPLEFAQQAADMVNNHGASITKACEKFGRNPGDLRYYCNKFGVKLNRKMRTWDYDATFPIILKLINSQGCRMKDASRKLECSPKLMLDILASKGYKYDAKTVKIRKIKK
jgi:hypothetical protein